MSSAVLTTFNPGALVRARGREWVVQPGSSDSLLRLRPLGGSEEDVTTLLPELEPERPEAATFPEPDPALRGNHTAAILDVCGRGFARCVIAAPGRRGG